MPEPGYNEACMTTATTGKFLAGAAGSYATDERAGQGRYPARIFFTDHRICQAGQEKTMARPGIPAMTKNFTKTGFFEMLNFDKPCSNHFSDRRGYTHMR